ncbi:hypothetical protein F5Y05DRAFT_361984 [Hypoxylon sp. FL0543]|nr:hypothetical protein F5Y05DRAFT_361984 [Hypoxylon sp. FL0543]
MDENNYLAAVELGLEPIHLASLEGDFEAVVRSACEPGSIDALTEPQTGAEWRLRETPIKLAALMGHLDIVEFLIERGATLAEGRLHASSYVGDEGLAARRREFFLRTVKIGREHPDAVNTRKVIYDLLSSPARRSVASAMRGTRADLGFPDYKLAKQGRDIVVYAPVLRIRTDIRLDRRKTIGIIMAKGDSDILMAAHSGYRLGGDRGEKCLDTNEWNYIALNNIAALLKFHFPANRDDNGNKPVEDEHRGRAHAGHVEVLLASWYALELTKKSTGNHNADLSWLLARLHTLKRATLGRERSAVIMIDNQPCPTCLKFLNHLFQYTGLHFSVNGGIGVGPTLATKDPRNNMRFDTFGDVFEPSDGEDSPDSPSTMLPAQGVAGGIRSTIEQDGGRGGAMREAQAAGEALARMLNSRFSPLLDVDASSDIGGVSPTTPPEVAAASRVAPITPTRARMQWPILEPGSRSRRAAKEHPFRDIPSHRPENHHELLAEYKKKTPVWDFPGYESAVPEYRPQHPTPRAAAAGLGPFTTSVFAARKPGDATPEPMEDTILIDTAEGNEGGGYPSPGSSSGAETLRSSMVDVNSRVNANRHNVAHTPTPPSRAHANFSYSCFAPIPSQPQFQSQPQRDSSLGSNVNHRQSSRPHRFLSEYPSQHLPSQHQSLYQSQPQHRPQTQSQSPNQAHTETAHSDIHMQSCSSSSSGSSTDDDCEYYYVPRPQPQPQPPHQPQRLLRLKRPLAADVISLNSDSDSDYDPVNEQGKEQHQQQRGRDPTPCPVPVPGVTRLQQWRYKPQPRARTLTGMGMAGMGVKAGGAERFTSMAPRAYVINEPVPKGQPVTPGPLLQAPEGWK